MGYLRIPPMGVYVTPHGVLFMYTHTLDGFGKEYASQAGRYKVCFEYPALNKQSDFQIFVPKDFPRPSNFQNRQDEAEIQLTANIQMILAYSRIGNCHI